MTMHCGCVCQEIAGHEACCLRKCEERGLLPLAFGGTGLRSAVRLAVPAYWASWEGRIEHDLPTTQNSGATLVHELSGHSTSAHLNATARSTDQLMG